MEDEFAEELAKIEPSHRTSARNFLHYLSIRQHDIRGLQNDLASLGLSSLGILEPHVLDSLNTVLEATSKLSGTDVTTLPIPPVDYRTGPLLLRDHTRALIGSEPQGRYVRIMVTMPSQAATDPALVRDLLAAGMDVMRINCAHDSSEAWAAMIRNLREAERLLGRSCQIQADLAGPKLRTGSIRPYGRILRIKPIRDAFGRVTEPGKLWIPASEGIARPSACRFTLHMDPDLVKKTQLNDTIRFTDTRDQLHELRVVDRSELGCIAETHRTAYIAEGCKMLLVRKLDDSEQVIHEGHAFNIPEVVAPIRLWPGELLVLTRENLPGEHETRDADGKIIVPAHIHCTLETAFEQVSSGQSVWLDDGTIGGIVKENDGNHITLQITHTAPDGAKLKAEKGINFPDTDLHTNALTSKDLDDLAFVCDKVDMVALSFLRSPDDVEQLHNELYRLNAAHLGIILKIENRQAFKNLPKILLTSLNSPPVGVMIARGDLAVEMGFARLSEIQEEILWLCEAAHVPVIWATQILESMAKGGSPSRAEVSDAAMSIRAECAMLNKGPNIVETVRFLSGIISRMDDHYTKRKATLRKLGVASL